MALTIPRCSGAFAGRALLLNCEGADMHTESLERWRHSHAFGTQAKTRGEVRTWWVIALTSVMMVIEVIAGTVFGSMALLADGWHMGTHAAALGVTAFAYVYARRHATDPRYTFGTGKVGALGGFASAMGLAVIALLVLGESARRLAQPAAIHYDEAIAVAVVGLVVNLLCAWLLRDEPHEHASDAHAHEHHHDHNLRAAYLHVLADALTSLLAIVALSAGKLIGWTWMDPMMGLVGALVIARWSVGLMRDTSRVLLDAEVAPHDRDAMVAAIERDADNRVTDLHVWRVGPRHLAAIVSLVTHEPRDPAHYKDLLKGFTSLAHVSIEVHACTHEPARDEGAER